MGLEITQLTDILKEPKLNRTIQQKAVENENRARFHGVSISDNGVLSARSKVLQWVKDILPSDKFKMFDKLLKTSDSLKLVSEIYQQTNKVFEGVNSSVDYNFTNQEYLTDYQNFKGNNFTSDWTIKAFDKMKTAYNSLLVVDLPTEQTSTLPEPYYYWLNFDKVISYEYMDGAFSYVMFKGKEENQVYCYDDTYYRMFYVDGDTIKGEILEVRHDLNKCPIQWFWSDLIDNDKPELKRGPLTDFLDKLDWLLFFSVSKRYSDSYAPYPIYWGYSQSCEYDDGATTCASGYLVDNNGLPIIEGGVQKECPGCGDRINGVGSFVDVPPPSEANDNAQLAPPVGMVGVDVDALNYSVEEVKRLEQEIYQAVTGNTLESVNHKQAVNEMQVMAMFEARTQSLVSLKRNFENAQKFVESTICQLRYGSSFIDCHIDYGNEFYLYTASDILSIYQSARAEQVDVITLDLLQDRYYDTLFRTDPKQRDRMRIVLNLDPYRHLTNEQAKEVSELEQDPSKYLLKVNLSSLIMRFERENGPIETFGILLERFDRRIELIQNTLLTYLNNNNGQT